MAYFPFMIEIEGKSCLVAGGGSVALHKIKKLLNFGVHIRVVAVEICEELLAFKKQNETARLEIIQKEFEDNDIENMDFVIAATDKEELNSHISDLCHEKHILVNVVDVKEACSFIFPAMIQKKDLLVAISTGGQSPAAAAYVKNRIKDEIPDYYGDMIEHLGHYREYVSEQITSSKVRKEVFEKLLAYANSNQGKIPRDVVETIIKDGKEKEGAEHE